jgi:hypothetical protein
MLLFLVNLVLGLATVASTVLATKECWRLGVERMKDGAAYPLSQATQNFWLVGTVGAFAVLALHAVPFNGLSLLLAIVFLATGFLPYAALRLGEESEPQRIVEDELGPPTGAAQNS